MQVVKRDGSREPLDRRKLARCVERACEGLADVSPSLIINDAYRQVFDGVKTTDVHRVAVMSAISLAMAEPNYSYAAARLLMHGLYREAFGHSVNLKTFNRDYREAFKANIHLLVDIGRFNPKMVRVFDLDKLAAALEPKRDLLLKHAGVTTLYDRYINHVDGRRLETPQAFFMRVAMGLCVNEDDPTARAAELYELISTLRYSPATPTLLNSGKAVAQMSSCYVMTMEDSIDGIYGTLHKAARLSKYGGGLGIDVTPLRGPNAYIRGTNGKGNGLIAWAKQYNDMVLAVNQGGSRKGAGCLYLEPWHTDFLDFLDLRKSTGDERRRCHDIDTASWIPDELMERVRDNKDWYFFCPSECPNLHETYGEEFSREYANAIRAAEAGELRNWNKMPARDLWKKMLAILKEAGHPWVLFKDAFNHAYMNKRAGVIRSSQLCCVAGDQRASTDRGLVRVRDLAEEGGYMKVASRDGVKDASPMALTIKNSPLVRVDTEEGYSHKVTPDHPLWVPGRGWVEAKDLVPGDRVEIQRTYGLHGDIHEPGLALICGLLAGDGTFGGCDAACVDLWGKNWGMQAEVETLVKRVLADNAHLFEANYKMNLEPHFVQAKEARKARLTSTALGKVLQHFGVTKETKVAVPEFVWRGDRETVGAFLRGLFVTDGTYQAIPKKMTVASYSSNRLEFLQDLQILLMSCGVKSRIRPLHEAGYRDMPDGHGGSVQYYCQATYRLLITSIRSGKNLEEISGAAATRGHAGYLANLANSEGYPERLYAVVSSVTPLDNEDVYCLMVDSEDRAWTCNGLVTKNTEIGEHTVPTTYLPSGEVDKLGELAVCNLASINVGAYVLDGDVDWRRLAEDVPAIMRGLDNVIDENFYPVPEAELSNKRYRFVGLGVMGWADLLQKLSLPFDSDEAVDLADRLQEFISYHAISASIDLARERGAFPQFSESEWCAGKLPFDMYGEVMAHRPLGMKSETVRLDWEALRRRLAECGIRNALTQAPAPTATIATITGCSEGIGPMVRPAYIYSTITGELFLFSETFVNALKERGLWTPELKEQLQRVDFDVLQTDLPADIKAVYKTAWDINQKQLIRAAALRQKWIDQAQSLNIYYKGSSMKELSDLYFLAWDSGLKSTYYLHGFAASAIAKTTIVQNAQEPQQAVPADDDQLPPSCALNGPCESCQ